jgi:riboflavin kinase/FMN adenylyltransferase
MESARIVKDLAHVGTLASDIHLAIGIFDGLHRGHQLVLQSAIDAAASTHGIAAVLSFDPHPSELFRPSDPTRLMMPIEYKLERLRACGVQLIICQHFDRQFASVCAEDFLPYLKGFLPSLASIHVGENFRYGRQRLGSLASMLAAGPIHAIQVSGVARALDADEVISSTRIRKQLELGAIAQVNRLLGSPYQVYGTVVEGQKIGRQLGFPTLNLNWAPACQPKFGVYAVRFREAGTTTWQAGVANYGIKPTLQRQESDPCLEVHALPSCRLTQGTLLQVEWLHFVRAERRFDTLESLKRQIAKDTQVATEFFASEERLSS